MHIMYHGNIHTILLTSAPNKLKNKTKDFLYYVVKLRVKIKELLQNSNCEPKVIRRRADSLAQVCAGATMQGPARSGINHIQNSWSRSACAVSILK